MKSSFAILVFISILSCLSNKSNEKEMGKLSKKILYEDIDFVNMKGIKVLGDDVSKEDVYFMKEFVLWGLVSYDKLSKDRIVDGYQFSDIVTGKPYNRNGKTYNHDDRTAPIVTGKQIGRAHV